MELEAHHILLSLTCIHVVCCFYFSSQSCNSVSSHDHPRCIMSCLLCLYVPLDSSRWPKTPVLYERLGCSYGLRCDWRRAQCHPYHKAAHAWQGEVTHQLLVSALLIIYDVIFMEMKVPQGCIKGRDFDVMRVLTLWWDPVSQSKLEWCFGTLLRLSFYVDDCICLMSKRVISQVGLTLLKYEYVPLCCYLVISDIMGYITESRVILV